jgi:DNA modification methylase
MDNTKLNIVEVPINELHGADYNPRCHSKEQMEQLKESLRRFGFVDPVICNKAKGRENVIIGGHFRVDCAKTLNIETVPVVYINIPEIEREKELNLRLNKNTGDFDLALLKQFDEAFLSDVGFSSEDLDDIFPVEENPEIFDLEKELEKLNIDNITMKTGEVYDLDGSRLMIGDSTIEANMLKLMGDEKADAVITDPPYLLNYLKGKKKNGEVTEGFGLKRNRKYLGTDTLPDNFTELWMANVNKIQKDNFHILVYENWKNIRTIWNEMEKYWKVKNMIVWHLPNRTQGFSAKYKLFNKHDIAMVGTTDEQPELNTESEPEEMLQNEYETALFAVSGKPHWESYEKGKAICPTDFIEYKAADEKSSGQGIIFGTKPLEILIPYIKVLTKRGDLILEPFGGSGSTLCAATKMNRRCYLMEKSPVYAEVIRNRWEKLTGKKAVKIYD